MKAAEEEFQKGFNKGNFLGALFAFKAALRREAAAEWSAFANWRIAESYHRMCHYQEAETFWRKAQGELFSEDLARKAQAALAECLFKTQRLDEAMPLFQSLAASEGAGRLERGWALYRLGDILTGLRLGREAGLRYDQAGSYNVSPKWIPRESLNNIINRTFGQKDFKKARFHLMTALSFHPEDPLRPRWLYLLSEQSARCVHQFGPPAVIEGQVYHARTVMLGHFYGIVNHAQHGPR